eukprot:c20911_g1_i1.p1 GENE.c20911_g1_i1~~c20911_g1_i1.p1  ORF type:complete len:238 (+),score=40.32 c20911_g1_i1:44-715(+)
MDFFANTPLPQLSQELLETIWTDTGRVSVLVAFVLSVMLSPPLSTFLRSLSITLGLGAAAFHHLKLEALVALVLSSAISLFVAFVVPASSLSSSSSHSSSSKSTEQTKPLPRGECRDYTLKELQRFDGSDSNLPVLLSIKGKVYDVTRGRDFYGKGGPYNVFAGTEAARALAKVSTSKDDVRTEGQDLSLDDLTAAERDSLDSWICTFEAKYFVIGNIIPVPQ